MRTGCGNDRTSSDLEGVRRFSLIAPSRFARSRASSTSNRHAKKVGDNRCARLLSTESGLPLSAYGIHNNVFPASLWAVSRPVGAACSDPSDWRQTMGPAVNNAAIHFGRLRP
jgi:hypothetical protein